jgi:NAD(P)-dependent dehydrogenase (short-subunit alcohol dehydrogenase family)
MLKGKKVIVMGGSSGIGLATAQAAAAEGADVVVVSSNKDRVDEAVKSLPGKPEGHAVDLSTEKAVESFFARVGAFDHLVYSAGENLALMSIGDLDLEKARQFFNIRYWGALTAVKYGWPHIQPGGSICLTSGTAGLRPRTGFAVVSTLCTAMEGLTRALAVELAPIRVNLVMPGVIRTNLWNSIPEPAREAFYESEAKRLPVGRIGEAEDAAATYLYFMNNPYITGQVIVVDGGGVLA